jgi:hypothetical protein
MSTNLSRYETDLKRLVEDGNLLLNAMVWAASEMAIRSRNNSVFYRLLPVRFARAAATPFRGVFVK